LCVGKILALLQGWLLCVGFVHLANVPKCVWAVEFKCPAATRTVAGRVAANEQGLLQFGDLKFVSP